MFRRTVVLPFMHYTGLKNIHDNKDRSRSNTIHTPRELIEKPTNSYGFYGSARKDIPKAFSVELWTPPNTRSRNTGAETTTERVDGRVNERMNERASERASERPAGWPGTWCGKGKTLLQRDAKQRTSERAVCQPWLSGR